MRPEKIQACKLFWQRLLHDIYSLVTLLTPVSDWDRISPYNIKQTSDKKREKYQLGDYKLIQYQIFHTNITRIV